MKISWYLNSSEELERLDLSDVLEVVVTSKSFSRLSNESDSELEELIKLARAKNLKVVLLVDLLLTDDAIGKLLEKLNYFSKLVDSVRAIDFGIANYVYENLENKIQILIEIGCHNILSLKALEEAFKDRLESITPSFELDILALKKYASELKTPLNIMAYSQVILNYVPRKLLSASFNSDEETLHATAKSLEGNEITYDVVQNDRGTFVIYPKIFNLLSDLEELQDAGINFISINGIDKIEEFNPELHFKGFFKMNRTSILFSKLKNEKLNRVDNDIVGTVVDTLKDKYIGIELNIGKNLIAGTAYKFKTPDGKVKDVIVKKIFDYDGVNLIYIPYISGITAKTLVINS